MEAIWIIEVIPYIGTTDDDYGNETPTWSDKPLPRAVYGWAPAGTNESNASRHTVTADIELFAPSDFTLDSKDHVRILGLTYEVQGDVEDFDHGPFGYTPGVRVNLRRFGA